MRIPDVGDEVYITALDSMYYGCRAIVKSRREGKVYNYSCEYHYVVQIDAGNEEPCIEGLFNDLEISFNQVKTRKEVLAERAIVDQKHAIHRISLEIGHLTKEQQQECLAQFLFQAIDGKIDSAEVVKNLFK